METVDPLLSAAIVEPTCSRTFSRVSSSREVTLSDALIAPSSRPTSARFAPAFAFRMVGTLSKRIQRNKSLLRANVPEPVWNRTNAACACVSSRIALVISDTPPTPVASGISREFEEEDDDNEFSVEAEIADAVLFCHLTAADATFAAPEKDKDDIGGGRNEDGEGFLAGVEDGAGEGTRAGRYDDADGEGPFRAAVTEVTLILEGGGADKGFAGVGATGIEFFICVAATATDGAAVTIAAALGAGTAVCLLEDAAVCLIAEEGDD